MKKYKAYKITLVRHVDGYSAHWRIQAPNTYYYHRVGGPAYISYNPDSRIDYVVWILDGEAYPTEAEYQKALEARLG